jgi:hypothetical protein
MKIDISIGFIIQPLPEIFVIGSDQKIPAPSLFSFTRRISFTRQFSAQFLTEVDILR